MGKPKAVQLWRHALEVNDYNLAAQLILAASLEVLNDPKLAGAPYPTRAAALSTFALNQLQPALARA